MKLKYLFNLLLITFPLVFSSGCDEIDKTLANSIGKCTTNKEGEITGLEIINSNLSEEQVNELLSYNLTNLSYTVAMPDGSYDIPERSGFSGIPTAINNLKNLESLKIFFDSYIHPCSSDCQYAGITNLVKNVLKDLKNLKSLYIGGINVSQDNIDEISTLENLEELTFYFSYLDETINYESLGNLKKLYKLNVQNTALGYVTLEGEYIYKIIPEGLIKANKGIKELTMLLNAVSINKDDLPNLEKLTISWNGDVDTSFLEQFDNITDLKISFRGNYAGFGDEYVYSNINADLTKLKNLKSLYISNMFIKEELMDRIINIPNLENLTLGYNRILDEGFYEKLKSIKTLSSLHLLGSYSKDMEDAIKSFSNLRSIAIQYVSLEKIPEFIYSLKDLEYLDLSYNSIKTVDEELSNLTNLKHLDLSSNVLLTVPLQIMNLKKLEYLNLSDNQIYDESPEYLNDFENLKYFYINKNKNLYGRVITNENLIECSYNNDDASYDLCIPKGVEEVKCLSSIIKYETCNDESIQISTNGLCGKDNGRCPYGQCCGKDGKCGTTKDYCSINKDCQMKYGSCINECQEINEYLFNNNMGEVSCIVNNEGKAIEIELDNMEKENDECQNKINQLQNLHSLEKLTLYDFDYDNIDLTPLQKIEKLTDFSIFFSYNGLTAIPEPVLSLTNLKRLEITYTGITSIPDSISNFKNLEYLNLGEDISEISPKIGELENLKEIDLSFCKVKKVPVEFGNLKNLEKLDLSDCKSITNFSEFIGNLENLKYLDLEYCGYNEPKEIGNLSKLEELNLYGNNIETLPKEFENLKNLKTLNLRYNSLSEFPEFIGSLEKLEKLDMGSNSISDEIPKSYNNLSNLTEIDVTFNVDIRGETLTNKNLVICRYDAFENDKVYSLCRHENDSCLEKKAIQNYKLCDNPSANTTTTVTPESSITTVINTTTDKLESTTTTITSTTINTTTESTNTTTTTNTVDNATTESTNTTTTNTADNATTESTNTTTTINSVDNATTDKLESTITTITTEKTTTVSTKAAEATVVEGRCGKDFGNCKSGECCSKYGWCGKSDDHCAVSKGCQSSFGECKNENNETPTSLETSTTTTSTEKTVSTSEDPKLIDIEYRCGIKFYNAKCPSGECCSKHGWCGKTNDHCDISKGCQSEFGECNSNSTVENPETNVEKPETNVEKPESNVEGRCGEGYGKCPDGQCCSKYGWCGKAYIYCSVNAGCKSEYGLCTDEVSVEGKCGEGYGKCPDGQCCSKYGWCGTSTEYCDSGCQSEFGKCN